MQARIAREWLQKHPTPRDGEGAFHWHPGALDDASRAELAASAGPDVTVWLAPGRVVVARRFGAIAPADGRRYAGLAVVAVTGATSAAALLEAAELPAARPWDGEEVAAAVEIGEPVACAAGPAVAADAVRALRQGGAAGEVEAATLAGLAAAETWLPDGVRALPRMLRFGDGAAIAETVDEWLARAVAARGPALARARAAWRALGEHADAEGRSIVTVHREVAAMAAAFGDAAALRAYLATMGLVVPARACVDGDGDAQWTRVLHAWGRGWLARGAREVLAEALVRRALADQLALAEPVRPWWTTVRWEAALPAASAAELEAAARARMPATVEVGRG